MSSRLKSAFFVSIAAMAAVANSGSTIEGPAPKVTVFVAALPSAFQPIAPRFVMTMPATPAAANDNAQLLWTAPVRTKFSTITRKAEEGGQIFGVQKPPKPIVMDVAAATAVAPKTAPTIISAPPAYAPQFTIPAQSPGLVSKTPKPTKPELLHSQDTAYVAQISTAEARQYFERAGLRSQPIDQAALGEFDFSQLEQFSGKAYADVIEDPKAPGKLIVRPIATPAKPDLAKDAPLANQPTDKNNEKSPAEAPKIGGSAEFE